MRQRPFVVLLLATMLAAIGAAGVVVFDRPPVPSRLPDRVLPGFEQKLENAAAIEITHRRKTLRLERRGDGWVAASAGGYPVRQEVVRETLLALADLTPVEPKTTDPQRYERLGLDEPGENARSTAVRVFDTSGAMLAGVVLGDRPSVGVPDSMYARSLSVSASWLVTPDAAVSPDLSAWADTVLTQIDRTRVATVRVTHPDGDSFAIARTDESDRPEFVLTDPPNATTNRIASVNSLARALTGLRFRDAMPMSSRPLAPADAVVARFVTDDGLTVIARTWPASAAGSGGAETDGVQTDDLAFDTEERFLLTLDLTAGPDASPEAVAEATEVGARVHGLVFEITDFAGNALRLRADDLVDRIVIPSRDEPAGPLAPTPSATDADSSAPNPVPASPATDPAPDPETDPEADPTTDSDASGSELPPP